MLEPLFLTSHVPDPPVSKCSKFSIGRNIQSCEPPQAGWNSKAQEQFYCLICCCLYCVSLRMIKPSTGRNSVDPGQGVSFSLLEPPFFKSTGTCRLSYVLEQLQNSQDNVIDVAKAGGLRLLGMMQATCPVHSDVRLLLVQLHCTGCGENCKPKTGLQRAIWKSQPCRVKEIENSMQKEIHSLCGQTQDSYNPAGCKNLQSQLVTAADLKFWNSLKN